MHRRGCETATPVLAPIRRLRTHIFFIANNDKSGDGIPTLKRAELGANGFTVTPLVAGIENLQVEYGIDAGILAGPSAAATGQAGAFTADPDLLNTCVVAACQRFWRNTVAIKLNLLARTVTTSAGYVDAKKYTLGRTAGGADNVVGPYNDGYRRNIYNMTVKLNNVSGRNGS